MANLGLSTDIVKHQLTYENTLRFACLAVLKPRLAIISNTGVVKFRLTYEYTLRFSGF